MQHGMRMGVIVAILLIQCSFVHGMQQAMSKEDQAELNRQLLQVCDARGKEVTADALSGSIRSLVASKADVTHTRCTETGRSATHILIDAIRAEERSDLLPALKALLESLIHVNAVDSHGRTPLAAALDPALSANGARYRHNNASERSKTLDYTIVDMLLASRSPETQGVSPEYSSILMDMRNTQLLETHFVAKKGFLRPNPAWSDGGDRYTLLCVAVASQNRQAIERFLALGAPWKFTDSNDRSISIFDWAKDPRHPYDTQLLEAVLKDRKEAAMDTE